jgi:hypothetical protein
MCLWSCIPLISRGVFPERRTEGRSGTRRPRARLVTSHSGALGGPSAGITTGCLQWLDEEGRREAKASRIGAGLKPALVSARKHGSEALKNRRSQSAGRRLLPASRRRTPHQRLRAASPGRPGACAQAPRLPALCSPPLREFREGLPRADTRGGADDARPYVRRCLKCESECGDVDRRVLATLARMRKARSGAA